MTEKRQVLSPTKSPNSADWFSRIVSVLAFLTSVATVYFQFFHADHKLIGAVIRGRSTGGVYEADVLIVNSGNRTEVVGEIDLLFAPLDNSDGTLGAVVAKSGPILLSPNQAQIVKLRCEVQHLALPADTPVHISVNFSTIDQTERFSGRDIYIDHVIGFKIASFDKQGDELGSPQDTLDHGSFANLYQGAHDN